MKRIMLLFCAAAAAVLSGCGLFPMIQGSGNPATASFDMGSYSRIAASQACKVHVVPDTVASLVITVDDNLVSYLEVRKTGADSVQIGLRQGYNFVGTTFSAEVHVPSLAALDLSGASEAVVAPGFPTTPVLSVTLSGASSADLQGIAATALSTNLSGASTLTASGSAGSVTAVLSGASQARLLGCQTSTARVDLSGASECWIDVGSGTVDLAASGASTLYYRGAPSLRTLNLSGGSSLVKVY